MKKVLIIEDDEFFRELISKKLSGGGFEVSFAANGLCGLENIKKNKPDLVFLDLMLPDIDGFEILRRVGNDQDLSSVSIIILSNLGQREDIDRGLKLGAKDYLIKSQIDIDEIVGKVKKYI